MKFMHLGDLHLGKSLCEFDLIEDQKYILDQILEIINKESVDALLIAGDVYDKSVPSEAATHLLDGFIKTLSERCIKTFIISGNHDSDERLNFGSSLFESNGIYISSLFKGELFKRTLEDEYGKINIFLLPFIKASEVRQFYPDEKIEDYDAAVRLVINKAKVDASERNIIVSHQFVCGGSSNPTLSGSEGMQAQAAAMQTVGTVERIGADVFDAFDYAALGHIHGPQSVGRMEVRYSGSPLKYSLSEVNNTKTVPIITLSKKGEIDISLHELKPMRDLRHLKGQLKTLLDAKNVCNTNDFIYATLTDEDVISGAMGIFRQTYPNTVSIDYDNSHTQAIDNVNISEITTKRSYDELVTEFYRKMYGTDISDEEMRVMKNIAKEVGILEAD